MPNPRRYPEQFQTEWRRIVMRWQKTSAIWTDQTHAKFQQQYWDPLARETARTQARMADLIVAMESARRRVR